MPLPTSGSAGTVAPPRSAMAAVWISAIPPVPAESRYDTQYFDLSDGDNLRPLVAPPTSMYPGLWPAREGPPKRRAEEHERRGTGLRP